MEPGTASSPARVRGRTALALCTAVAGLILYGSWFPFEWIHPHPDDVWWGLTNLQPLTGRADLLGNVALFLPWGLAAAWAARLHRARPAAWALGAGLLLALLAQAGQFFEAHRDPRWADVLWNLVGAAGGLAAACALPRLQARPGAAALALLAGSALTAWLPLWPTLDAARLQRHWARLAELGAWQGPEAAMMAGLALVAGSAAAAWLRHCPGAAAPSPAALALAMGAAGAALLAGQLLVPGTRLSAGGALGVAAGTALAMALHARPRALAVALAALQVAGGLSPFDFQPQPVQALHWLPFEALLGGSMVGNAQALARDAWLWGCALWFAARGGWPPGRTALALAVLALAVEVLQCWMPSRTADVTPALVVLGLGWGLAVLRPVQTRAAAH